MKYKKSLLVVIFLLSFSTSANAAINFRIDNKDIPKTRILINTTEKNNPQAGMINADVEEILSRVRRNLKSTDLFDIDQKDGVAAVDLSIEKVPDFVRYSSAGVGMLLVIDGNFNQASSALHSSPLAQPSGDLEIKVRLWDVVDERQLFGKFYSSNNFSPKR